MWSTVCVDWKDDVKDNCVHSDSNSSDPFALARSATNSSSAKA